MRDELETGARVDISDSVSRSAVVRSSSTLKDARAVKSGEALRNALLTLIETKPLEQITVRDIVAEAGIHYATFFRHHPDKEALLDHVAAEQIDELVDLTLPVLDSVDSYSSVVALFTYVQGHRVVWTALLTGGAAAAMRNEMLSISARLATDRAPPDGWLPVKLAVQCSVSLIFETLVWWLAQSIEEVGIEDGAKILHRLLTSVQLQP